MAAVEFTSLKPYPLALQVNGGDGREVKLKKVSFSILFLTNRFLRSDNLIKMLLLRENTATFILIFSQPLGNLATA